MEGTIFHGLIDELEISNTLRSAGWIGTKYNNESSPSTFYSLGSQEGFGELATPTFSPAGDCAFHPDGGHHHDHFGSIDSLYHRREHAAETSGTVYGGPITVSSTTTIHAIAYESGMTDSLVASATYTIAGSSWYNTSWSDRTSITIDHTKVAGASNLSNFPVLVSLTDANLATVVNGGNVGLADGSDILFTAADGATKLNHEIEQYNPATGQLIAWVQIPTVSPTTDTVIYVYYGNASASNQQNTTGVWDSNFQQVLHLDESSGTTLFDSTSNANNGSKVSATSPAATSAGEIAGAQTFNGTSDFVVLPPTMTNGLSVFSVSFWAQSTDTGSNGTYWNRPQFVGDASNGAESGDFGINTNNGDLGMWSGLNSASDNSFVTNTAVNDNKWHHIAAVNDGSTIRLYLDGQDTGQSLSWV